jgi:sulfite exporter TauE/SafE
MISVAGRFDLTAAAVLVLCFIGIIEAVKHSEGYDEDSTTLATFVVWLVTTVFSCVLFDFDYLFRVGRVLTMVWLGLAMFFLGTRAFDSLQLSIMGIITGVVLINIGIYTREDAIITMSTTKASRDNVHGHRGIGRRDDHRYELAVAEGKHRSSIMGEATDLTEDDHDESEEDVI